MPTLAQPTSGPVYVEPMPAVARPLDHRFDGVVELYVDATDVRRQIFNIRQRVPVTNVGSLTLLYPRWEAGSHGPSLTVTDIAGLVIKAGGQPIAWRRDSYEPHAFHLTVPPGTSEIDLSFQMVGGGDLLMENVIAVPWQRLILYPAGWYARNIAVAPTLTLPDGLHPFTALDVARATGATVHFSTTTLETLLDAPVLAGRYTTQVPLTAPGRGAVSLDVVALRPDDLTIPDARVAELKSLVAQLRAVFGPAPYNRYDILARLSDDGSSGGTEHRASSENSLSSSHFRDWPAEILYRDLIAHELVHAWNGLHRTPADLWAPTPNVPVAGSLLWMYEGQSEFWGRILAARAGQLSHAEWRDRLAIEAAEISHRPGRSWRPLSDDVNYPAFMLRRPVPWRDWQRRRDYYSEGLLLWLAVDAELRVRSGGQRSIDDFAQRFFAGAAPDTPARTYTFDDILHTLDSVVSADWAGFLRTWIDAREGLDTLTGLTAHGWKLIFTDTPTAAYRAGEEEADVSDLSYSIGLAVRGDGLVRTVAWDGPAFRAGMRPGIRIVTIGGAPFAPDVLLDAIRNSAGTPITLTIEQNSHRSDILIDYAGRLRYPQLERIVSSPDSLTTLLSPR